MTRRDMLTRVLGAAVAAAVAPLVDLTDTTPAFWNQKPILERLPWRVQFGNTVYEFQARVIDELQQPDGTVTFTVKPDGPMKVSVEFNSDDINEHDPNCPFCGPDGDVAPEFCPVEDPPGDGIVREASGPIVRMGDQPPIEMTELDLPRADVDPIDLWEDGPDTYVTGLKRHPTFTFTGKWS